MTRRPRTATLAAVLAIAALALSACATSPAPATTESAPPPSETATPTPEPEPGSAQPASRYDLSCDELVPAGDVAAIFPEPVEPVDPLVTAASAGISVPRMTSVLSIGGLACQWGNGEPYNSQYGGNPAYAGVLITVVPPQEGGWSEAAASLTSEGGYCDSTVGCTFTRLPSDAWLQVEVNAASSSSIDPAAAERVADLAAASVESAGQPSAATTVETTLPRDCEELVATSDVEAATGITGLTQSSMTGGWSEWAEAKLIADDLGCRWFVPDSDESVVSAAWVRGGRWAYDRIADAGGLVPEAAEAGLDVSDGDVALVRCDPTRGVCAVDLVLGPDWIQVTAPEQDWAVGVAEQVVAGLAR